MQPQMIQASCSISEVLNQFPQVIPVFLRHQMICVGCDMAKFDSLQDAVNNYGLNLADFLEELGQASQQAE